MPEINLHKENFKIEKAFGTDKFAQMQVSPKTANSYCYL